MRRHFKSLLAGAVGYLLKGRSGSGAQVLEAVRDASRGGSPLNSLIARKIVQHFHHQPAHSGEEHPLSTREREVLELLSKGLPYKEIADMLAVNIETVRKHCHNLYEKTPGQLPHRGRGKISGAISLPPRSIFLGGVFAGVDAAGVAGVPAEGFVSFLPPSDDEDDDPDDDPESLLAAALYLSLR